MTLTFKDAPYVSQVMSPGMKSQRCLQEEQSSALVGANACPCPGCASILSATSRCFSLPSPVPCRAAWFKVSPPNTTTGFFQMSSSLILAVSSLCNCPNSPSCDLICCARDITLPFLGHFYDFMCLPDPFQQRGEF